jgi:two-component system LytT family response regulator
MIRTLIVDDVAVARDGLRARLRHEDDIDIVGEAATGPSAVDAINQLNPDLVFLDIEMPGLDGFQVLERAEPDRVPAIIFVTAHDRYAVRAFAAHALHFLMKPISAPRFQEALHRARRELVDERHRQDVIRRFIAMVDGRTTPAAPDRLDSKSPIRRLVVRDRDRFVLLKAEDVDWIESAGNYAQVHARGQTLMLRMTMSQLEEMLDPECFTRIHRSTIVNVDRVREIRTPGPEDFEVVLEDGALLRMSKRYRTRLIP